MEDDEFLQQRFDRFDLTPLRRDLEDLNRLSDGFGRTMSRAFSRAIISGRSFSSVLRSLVLSLSSRTLAAALTPLTNGLVRGVLGGFSLTPNAAGNVFSNGRVVPFANGGIVNSPVLFPMRDGAGLMGERGPEAILPLARGNDGRLGVRSDGGSPVTVNMNITTPDIAGFERSRGQIAGMIAKAAARGQRNL